MNPKSKKWYHSWSLWVGAAQVVYGFLRDDNEWVMSGVIMLGLRAKTKGPIEFKKKVDDE